MHSLNDVRRRRNKEAEILWRTQLDQGVHTRTLRAKEAEKASQIEAAREALLQIRREEMKALYAHTRAQEAQLLASQGLAIYHGCDGLE